MTRFLARLVCIFVVTACGSRGSSGPTPLPARSVTAPAPVESTSSAPGLVIRGQVRLSDGTGLANVTICRNFASYSGAVVATTDQTGYYQTPFAAIPGDEMVGVWPLLPGYAFEPDFARWRHYHGHEDKTLDFVASPNSATHVPPATCS